MNSVKCNHVQDSPVSSIKQKGNLTGNIRMVRDHVFDIYVLIQKWNSDLLDGMKIISEIRGKIYKKMNNHKSELESYSEDLQELSRRLEKTCENMETTVEKLGQKSANMQALSRLEERNEHRKIMFVTWPISKFVETSEQVYEMFRREIEMKIAVKEEICFCTNENTLIFYEAAWLHQPYIEKSVDLNLEAMLNEVGHPSVRKK